MKKTKSTPRATHRRCAVSTGSAPKATAARLARAVFACGDDVRGKCKRIQFKLRDWQDDEISGGGLCETALAYLLYRELRRKPNGEYEPRPSNTSKLYP